MSVSNGKKLKRDTRGFLKYSERELLLECPTVKEWVTAASAKLGARGGIGYRYAITVSLAFSHLAH